MRFFCLKHFEISKSLLTLYRVKQLKNKVMYEFIITNKILILQVSAIVLFFLLFNISIIVVINIECKKWRKETEEYFANWRKETEHYFNKK